MNRTTSPPPAARRSTRLMLALAAVAATITGTLSLPSVLPAISLADLLRGDFSRKASAADGALPRGATAFDTKYPGIANLDAGLRHALRKAASAAADEGITLRVNSGWRSPEYQKRLLLEAVSKYGSAAEAARWVATSETSAHVAGRAADIGPVEGAAWLAGNGAKYGLCQIYLNEPWHFELRPEAIENGCPPMYPDPSHNQ